MERSGGLLQRFASGGGRGEAEDSRGRDSGLRGPIETLSPSGVDEGTIRGYPFHLYWSLPSGIPKGGDVKTVGRVKKFPGRIRRSQPDGHRGISGVETAARFPVRTTGRPSSGPRFLKKGDPPDKSDGDEAVFGGLPFGQ